MIIIALFETGLQEPADTVVDRTVCAGLGRGQKKLTIALQLLRLPSVIFLDEATSGTTLIPTYRQYIDYLIVLYNVSLDSASSNELLTYLTLFSWTACIVYYLIIFVIT